MMLSLNISPCAEDIDKTNVNTTRINVWDMRKRNVFEAVASGGAGDLLFTMNRIQKTKRSFDVFDGLLCDRSRQQGLR